MAHMPTHTTSSSHHASLWDKLRTKVAQTLLNNLYGRKMYLSQIPCGAVSGCVVFWYMEGGVRHFVMIKDPAPEDQENKNKARFITCLDKADGQSIADVCVYHTKRVLGDVFYKSLTPHAISHQKVTALPVFQCDDELTGEKVPVHTAIWAVQITADQAQLCEPTSSAFDIVAVPEFAMKGDDVCPSHHMLYQAVADQLNTAGSPRGSELGYDPLDELLRKAPMPSKVIH